MGWVRRHHSFLSAFALGLGLFALCHALNLPKAEAALLGFDGFALAYLGQIVRHAGRTTAADLRRHAEDEDEGIALILLLALGAVIASLAAILLVLTRGSGSGSLATAGLALAAVPLGWAVVHTLVAFHYAHLHYAPEAHSRLKFPGMEEPSPWDFLYFSFTLGMAVQTSDVTITTSNMRRVVLIHSVLSFFYNTVILALAVNAGLALAG